MRRAIAFLLALVLCACTSGGEAVPTTSTSIAAPDSTSTTSTSLPATTTTLPPPPAEDLLTYSSGVLLLSSSGLDEGPTGPGLQLIDGDETPVVLATGGSGPVRLLYQLPSETTFDAFLAFPGLAAAGGHATSFGSITVSGSREGPDGDFTRLADAALASGERILIQAAVTLPVRWLEIVLEGVSDGAATDDRPERVFGEIVGTGTSAPQPDSDAFNGVWELRSEARPGTRGERLELAQDGAIVTGCLDTLEVRGTVSGAVARATGVDAASGRTAALVFVAGEDSSIHATVAFENGRFESRVAAEPERAVERSCIPPLPETAVCDTPLYVNFGFDSAEIRAESERVLDDIYRILVDIGVGTVTVIGHTSTEGTEAHNLELSEARASAVASALEERGFAPSAMTVIGRGESEPIISPEPDEASRAVNRRVELECG